MAVFYRVYPQIGRQIPQSLIAELGSFFITLKKTQSMIAEFAADLPRFKPRKSTDIKGGNSQSHLNSHVEITPLSAELVLHFSWTQLLELIRIDDPLKRAFYENECLKGNWSVRQLQRQIGSLLYERTGLSTNKKTVIQRAHRQEPQLQISELIRDPYVLEFTGLAERPEYNENELEKALLDHLQSFLLELGLGFCFEARQFRVTIGNEHDYIDLVFYHRLLRCHVLIDLKVRAFKHADVGQMNYYLNYFKKCIMPDGDNPPVGILLCSDRESTKVEFATSGMDNKLFVSRYLIALPSSEQLQQFLENDRAQIEILMLQTHQSANKRQTVAEKEAAHSSKQRTKKTKPTLSAKASL